MTVDLEAWRELGLFGWGVVVFASSLVAAALIMHVALVFYPPSTKPSTLKAPLPLVRWIRSLWLRFFAQLAGWPWYLMRLRGVRPQGGMASEHSAVELAKDVGQLLVIQGTGPIKRRPVLLVHAVVTEPWILDLTTETSLVAALSRAGHDVHVLDWARPTSRNVNCGIEWYVQVVAGAVGEVRRLARTDGVHVVGYCTGGLLALLDAAIRPDAGVTSVAAIAPPLDSATPAGITRLLANPHLRPVLLLDHHGLVPASVVRESFHFLRPQMLAAVRARLKMRDHEPGTRLTDALSAWLWHHRPVPGRFFYEMVELTRENSLMSGSLRLGDRAVDLGDVHTPVLVCLATRDHIVDAGSSMAVTTLLPEVELVTCGGGHVSMMLGMSEGHRIHDVLIDWLGRQEA